MIHTYGNERMMTIASYMRKIQIRYVFKYNGITHTVVQRIKKYFSIPEIRAIREAVKTMPVCKICTYLKDFTTPNTELELVTSFADVELVRTFIDVDPMSGKTIITAYEVEDVSPNKFKRGEIKKFKVKKDNGEFKYVTSRAGVARCGNGDIFNTNTGRCEAMAKFFILNGKYFV